MKTVDLDSFHGLNVKIDYEKIIDKHSKKAVNILQSSSPNSGRPRKTPYRLGWEVNNDSPNGAYRGVVWNRTNWQLTHLLENGHFITNQGALSWSAPRKHIKPAFLSVKNGFVHDMKNVKIEVDFK